jgi:hypothetical protein
VLRTLAPASAILLVRKREGYYDEDEVVVDPYKLMFDALPLAASHSSRSSFSGRRCSSTSACAAI